MNPSPHVLTYEDLACEQGVELLTHLFGGYWQYDAIGLFREWGERGEYQDYINYDEPCDDELRADFGFVSLILAGALPGRDSYQVGYDWKLPNGEVVKAVFLPKNQVND